MRPDPLERERRLAGDGCHQCAQLLGRRAHAVHARVHLHMDRAAAPGGTGGRRDLRHGLKRVQRRGEAVGEHGFDRVGVAFAEQEHRGLHVVLAQLDTLVHQRDGETACATRQRGAATAGPPCPYPCALTTAPIRPARSAEPGRRHCAPPRPDRSRPTPDAIVPEPWPPRRPPLPPDAPALGAAAPAAPPPERRQPRERTPVSAGSEPSDPGEFSANSDSSRASSPGRSPATRPWDGPRPAA